MNSEKIIEHIVSWLKDYAEKTKVKGFVVGISGGIDSAVTSSLCAMTGFETLCVEMPIHQEQNQVNRAKEHIENLKSKYPNVSSVETDLTSSFENFIASMPKVENSSLLDLTLANTRARIRMTTLYYFAGIQSSLVAGTGNKVEDFGVGFYTKYGDGGVDISPIADLMKSEVFSLASFLEVPNSIQSAKPTDGLFGDERSDEEQIGATYDELEWAMKADESGENITQFEGRKKEVFQIYKKRNNANKHKMNPIPVCVIPEEYK